MDALLRGGTQHCHDSHFLKIIIIGGPNRSAGPTCDSAINLLLCRIFFSMRVVCGDCEMQIVR